jgi:hypothetical protein
MSPRTHAVRKCIPPNTRASTASKAACDRLLKLRVMPPGVVSV